MAKTLISMVMGSARTVKSAMGLGKYFKTQVSDVLEAREKEARKFQDDFAGNSIYFYSHRNQSILWTKYSALDNPQRQNRIISAWISLASSKIEPLKLRVGKSKNPEWKEHLNNWENFIVRCREIQNRFGELT
jgi:hypothetical protein